MLVFRLISVAIFAVAFARAGTLLDQDLDTVDLETSDTRDRRTVGSFLNNIADFFGYDVNKRPSAALTAPAPAPAAPAPKAPAPPPPRPPAPAPRPAPPAPPVLTESVRKTFNIAFNWGRNVQKSAAPAPAPAPAPRPAPAPAPAPKPAPPPAPKPPPKKVSLLLADYNSNVVPIENANKFTEEYIKQILDCADKPEKIQLDLTNQSGKDLLDDDEDSEQEARRPPRYDSLADYQQSKKMFKEGHDKFWGAKPAWTEDSGYKYLTPYESESQNGENYQRIYRHDIATYEEVNHPGNEHLHHHHNSIRSLPDPPSTAAADASTHLDLVALLASEDNTHADTLILEQLLASFKEENLPANIGNAKVLLERGKINKYLFEYFKRKFQRDYERKKHAPVPQGPHVLHIDITTRPPPPTVKPFVSTANRDLLHILESLPTPKYEGHYGKLKEEQKEHDGEDNRGKHDHYLGNLHLGLKDHDHQLCAKVHSLKADRFVADKKMDDGESAKFLPLPNVDERRGASEELTQAHFVPTTASTYGSTSKEELKQFINDEIKNAIKILKDTDEVRQEDVSGDKGAESHAQLHDERPPHEERPSEIRSEENLKDYKEYDRPSGHESNKANPIEAIKQNYDQGLKEKDENEEYEDELAPAKTTEEDREDFGKQIHENIKLHQDKNVEYEDEDDEKPAPKSENLKKHEDDDEEKENIKDINDHENLEQETIEDDEDKPSEPVKHKDEEEAEEDDYYEAPWNHRFGEPSQYRNFADNVNKISKKYEENDDYDDRRPKYKSIDYSQKEEDNEDYDERKPGYKSQSYTQREDEAEAEDDDDRTESTPERSKTYEEIRDEKLPNNYEELADKAEAQDSGDSESVKTPQKQKTEDKKFPKFFDEKDEEYPEKKPLKTKDVDYDKSENKKHPQKTLNDDYFQNFFEETPQKEASDVKNQKVSEEHNSDKKISKPTDFFDDVFSEIKSDLKANAPEQITEVKPVGNEDDSHEDRESEQEETRQEERDYYNAPRNQKEEQKVSRQKYGQFFEEPEDKKTNDDAPAQKESQIFAHQNARPFTTKTSQLEPTEVSEDYYPIAEDIDYASGFGKKIKDVPKAQGFADDSKSEKSKQQENTRPFITDSPISLSQPTATSATSQAGRTKENFYNPLTNLDDYYYDTPQSSSQKQDYNKDDRTTIHPFLTFETPRPISQVPAETIKKPSPFLAFDNLENQGDFPNFATFNQEQPVVRNPSPVDPKQQILEHKPVKELKHNKLQEPVKAGLKAEGPVFGANTKSEVVQPYSGGVLHLDQEFYNSDKVLAVPFDYEYSGSEKRSTKSKRPKPSKIEPLSEEASYDVKDWYTDGRSNYYPDKYNTDFTYTIPDAAPVDYSKLEKNEPEPEQDDRLSDKAKVTEKTYGKKKGFVSVNQGSTQT